MTITMHANEVATAVNRSGTGTLQDIATIRHDAVKKQLGPSNKLVASAAEPHDACNDLLQGSSPASVEHEVLNVANTRLPLSSQPQLLRSLVAAAAPRLDQLQLTDD